MTIVQEVMQEMKELMGEAEVGVYYDNEARKATSWVKAMLQRNFTIWIEGDLQGFRMVADSGLNNPRDAQVTLNRMSGRLLCSDPNNMVKITSYNDWANLMRSENIPFE